MLQNSLLKLKIEKVFKTTYNCSIFTRSRKHKFKLYNYLLINKYFTQILKKHSLLTQLAQIFLAIVKNSNQEKYLKSIISLNISKTLDCSDRKHILIA